MTGFYYKFGLNIFIWEISSCLFYLSEAVREVVLEVSDDGPAAVLQQPHLGPRPRPREVGLQGSCVEVHLI